MIARIVLALVAGIIVFLVCVLVGGLLVTVGIPFVVTVGAFLKEYAGLLGLLAALVHFFGGSPRWGL